MNYQVTIVIVAVLLAGGFLFTRAVKKARASTKSGNCGPDCGCGK